MSADTTWRKLGRVYVAGGEHDWAASHAFVPTALDLGDRIRVLLRRSGTATSVGRVGWVDVDPEDPRTVLAVSERPALDVGEPGMFDDNGVTPLSVCEHDGGLRMYYAGWQLGTRVRYFLFTGAAESRDGGETFERVSRVPVLDRSDARAADPHRHVRPSWPGRLACLVRRGRLVGAARRPRRPGLRASLPRVG